MRIRKPLIVTAAMAGVVLAASGIAAASIPSSNGTFYACVKGASAPQPGEVIIKDDGGTGSITCGAAATPIQWGTQNDSGVVTYSSGACSLSNLTGPDAATLSVSTYGAGTCEISGLSPSSVITTTLLMTDPPFINSVTVPSEVGWDSTNDAWAIWVGGSSDNSVNFTATTP